MLDFQAVAAAFERTSIAEPISIPVGCCHGDLTLGNILFFKNADLVLLDFLDCFIETPLQDMAKLRQDTCFKWSYLVYDGDFDRTKMDIIMSYMDRRFDLAFSKYDYYRQYYDLFQFLNLLRILPYATEVSVVNRLCEALNTYV
jgi:Ser/Thr protein kinase RdoA (MazF antagonist)